MVCLSLVLIFHPHHYYYRRYHVYSRPAEISYSGLHEFLLHNLSIDDTYMGIFEARNISFRLRRNCISHPHESTETNLVPFAIRYNAHFLVIRKNREPWLRTILQEWASRSTPSGWKKVYCDRFWSVYRLQRT